MITITKIQNGAVILPREIQKNWQGTKVWLDVSQDTISIKKLAKPILTLKEMMDEFYRAAQQTKLSPKNTKRLLQTLRKKFSR